jgi:hypothetical protein
VDLHEWSVGPRAAQDVAHLPDVARDDERDAVAPKVLGEVLQHPCRAHVDERHRLGIEHDRPRVVVDVLADRGAHVLGVGEEEPALDAQHDDAGNRLVLQKFLELELKIPVPPSGQYTYYPGTTEVPERSAANVHGVSYKVLAEVKLTDSSQGVIFASGSRFGGHSLSSRTAS